MKAHAMRQTCSVEKGKFGILKGFDKNHHFAYFNKVFCKQKTLWKKAGKDF